MWRHDDEALISLVDVRIFVERDLFISLPNHRDACFQVSSDVVEVRLQRVAQSNPLMEHGVLVHKIDLAQVDLVNTNLRILENSF